MTYHLKDFGSFHVGGRLVEVSGKPTRTINVTANTTLDYDPNGRFLIEQLYVQYFIPAEQTHRLPVVMLHGGGLTGVTWENTPDGRPGWLHDFLAAGFAVYVIDNVERGRSGFCAIEGEWPDEPAFRSEFEAWWLFRFGTRENFEARIENDGQKFPLEAMENFQRQFVPRWTSTSPAQIKAVAQALDRIGDCVLICHSQGGHIGAEAVMQTTSKVLGVVSLEGSGFAEATRPEAVKDRPWLFAIGDFTKGSFWETRIADTEAFVEKLRAAGGKPEIAYLPDHGFPGATHMMMMDRNSAEIARWTMDWVRREVT
jgi:pimeloyl-ACP methyl ester carboxylesterase